MPRSAQGNTNFSAAKLFFGGSAHNHCGHVIGRRLFPAAGPALVKNMFKQCFSRRGARAVEHGRQPLRRESPAFSARSAK